MIDIESQVFDLISKTVDAEFGSGIVEVSGVYGKQPERFPFVSVIQSDCYPVTDYMTDDEIENFSVITFEINIYSNRERTKKSDVKKLAGIIDDVLAKNHFRRMSLMPMSNINDASVMRMAGRYSVIADKEHRLYYRR